MAQFFGNEDVSATAWEKIFYFFSIDYCPCEGEMLGEFESLQAALAAGDIETGFWIDESGDEWYERRDGRFGETMTVAERINTYCLMYDPDNPDDTEQLWLHYLFFRDIFGISAADFINILEQNTK